ncbi:hypothetical protein AB0M87_02530 [Streptomyces sp. NPDC051320]|uniref:Lsr2 family DNA-binding protein n=1 Tax=Streptomyces sp. NPDC051320 TaxID=3154644 RepID=UPI003445C2D9
MTIAALRALIDEELPDVIRHPAPRIHPSTKEKPVIPAPRAPHAAAPPSPQPQPIPVGQLLAWAAAHPDRTIRDHADKAHTSLEKLRIRHEDDTELARVDTEAAELEERLAALRTRRAELKPKKAGRVRDYEPTEVRTWARAQGIDVPMRGQVPKQLLDMWRRRNEVQS